MLSELNIAPSHSLGYAGGLLLGDREDDGDVAVDPPENQPGGNCNLDGDDFKEDYAAAAVDPPENQPGGDRQG